MSEKRFVYYKHKGADYILDTPNTELDFIEMLGDALEPKEIVKKLNDLAEKNNELQFQCNLLREQANEFHRGAIENANKVGKLEKENKELKKELLIHRRIASCNDCEDYRRIKND